jgi:hypothetical protein
MSETEAAEAEQEREWRSQPRFFDWSDPYSIVVIEPGDGLTLSE